MMCLVLLGGVWEPIAKWRTHMFTIFTPFYRQAVKRTLQPRAILPRITRTSRFRTCALRLTGMVVSVHGGFASRSYGSVYYYKQARHARLALPVVTSTTSSLCQRRSPASRSHQLTGARASALPLE